MHNASGGAMPRPAGARVPAGKGCAPVDEMGHNEKGALNFCR